MKTKIVLIIMVLMCFTFYVNSQSAKALSFNGTTGLISTPTAHIGWEKSADIGIDVGYHNIGEDGEDSVNVPKVNVSLFKKLEIGLAQDQGSQEEGDEDDEDNIISGKLQFYNQGNTAAAIGGDYQQIKFANGDDDVTIKSLYLVATYTGTFMNMPAITTVSVGKYFGSDLTEEEEENINCSMGFQLGMFPSVFKDYVYWINDFANYSYSYDPTGADAEDRGVLNTGIRIDPLKGSRYKFIIDIIMTDALDSNRAYTIGGTFGFGAK